MNNKQTIADQLGWCNTTRVRLEDFEHAIASVANGYDAITDELKNTAIFGEFLRQVEQRQDAFRSEMKQLRQQLHTENLAYVNKQSDRLAKELGDL